jgi:hypothetical protein
LTAPCVARPEEDTNAFDVGTEPDDDEVAVLDEADADVRDVDVVREVELAVKPVVGADLAVGLVDDRDWDVVAVEDPEPAV